MHVFDSSYNFRCVLSNLGISATCRLHCAIWNCACNLWTAPAICGLPTQPENLYCNLANIQHYYLSASPSLLPCNCNCGQLAIKAGGLIVWSFAVETPPVASTEWFASRPGHFWPITLHTGSHVSLTRLNQDPLLSCEINSSWKDQSLKPMNDTCSAPPPLTACLLR